MFIDARRNQGALRQEGNVSHRRLDALKTTWPS
jgi:hypothetical protein